jgi:hypothetical protein
MGHCLFVCPTSLPGSNQQLLDRDEIIKRLDSSTTFSCGYFLPVDLLFVSQQYAFLLIID